jgi:hypothetical protein
LEVEYNFVFKILYEYIGDQYSRSHPMIEAILCVLSLVVAPVLGGSQAAVWLLAGGQLALLVGLARKRELTGTCAFLFMSFLFFGVRPVYMALENDHQLLNGLFGIVVNQDDLNASLWWATAASLAFFLGAGVAKSYHQPAWRRRFKLNRTQPMLNLVTTQTVWILLLYQIGSLGVMMVLGSGGKGLYGSSLGAYAYDLPAILQAGHVFSLVVILERYLRRRDSLLLFQLGFAGLLFLFFTWQMRNVSMFRGFYLTGVLIGGIAVLSRLKKYVSAGWLIIPIVVVLPLFKILGEARYEKNGSIGEMLAQNAKDQNALAAYWHLYDSNGDMNIYDTFVAADKSKPAFKPYALTWIYVPFHWVPRALWKSKPKQGLQIDVKFMNGAPYCPGIAGFFLLDGGRLWMLGSMALLGYILSFLDWSVLTMQRGYLRCCFYGILVVNGMMLSRAFLWFYFYQVIYAIVPCMILSAILIKRRKGSQAPHGCKRSKSFPTGKFEGTGPAERTCQISQAN